MGLLDVYNLKGWIAEHRHLLRPPVGNAQVYKDRDFIIMIVGGPNSRKDYHVNPTEEFFYQVEGEATVRVMEEGKPRDITLGEGDILLLPPNVPHSPQRGPNTVGMVVERMRPDGQLDAMRWHCESCNALLHQATFTLQDITTQIKTAIETFFGDPSLCKCKACGAVMAPHEPV